MSGPENPEAFPFGIVSPMGETYTQYGMTLRDWFAGQALVGLLAGQFADSGCHNFDALPKEAFDVADAMLAGRARASS